MKIVDQTVKAKLTVGNSRNHKLSCPAYVPGPLWFHAHNDNNGQRQLCPRRENVMSKVLSFVQRS